MRRVGESAAIRTAFWDRVRVADLAVCQGTILGDVAIGTDYTILWDSEDKGVVRLSGGRQGDMLCTVGVSVVCAHATPVTLIP